MNIKQKFVMLILLVIIVVLASSAVDVGALVPVQVSPIINDYQQLQGFRWLDSETGNVCYMTLTSIPVCVPIMK